MKRLENYSNNSNGSPVAWKPTELTIMINYIFQRVKYGGILFILYHTCLLHPYQTKVSLNRNFQSLQFHVNSKEELGI